MIFFIFYSPCFIFAIKGVFLLLIQVKLVTICFVNNDRELYTTFHEQSMYELLKIARFFQLEMYKNHNGREKIMHKSENYTYLYAAMRIL